MRHILLLSVAFFVLSIRASDAEQNPVDELVANTNVLLGIMNIVYGKKTDEEVVDAVKNNVRGELRDPASSRFNSIKLFRKTDMIYACGRVNAKNAFGGYTGFQWFMAGPSAVTFFESEAAGQIMIEKYCQ